MQYHISHTRERIPLEQDWPVQGDLLLSLIVLRSPKPPQDAPAFRHQGNRISLELGEFRILRQHPQEDGSIEVEVIAKTDRTSCPHCQRVSGKVHDRRPLRKRDLPLRGHRIVLVLFKRRFHCLTCRCSFTAPDQALGHIGSREGVKRSVKTVPDLAFIENRSVDTRDMVR